MKFFLIGYMGSGKSTVGKLLSEELNHKFYDLDQEIEKEYGLAISEIFARRGEIFFRKAERKMLQKLIALDEDAIVSLGGGTPCYGDNMELIKNADSVRSIYLKLNIQTLLQRLKQGKEDRPMISHLETEELLEEFIRKHLFERGFYYNQSELILDCNGKDLSEITQELMETLR
ncbi:shikimate kinase [Christiangramia sp. OXR-203]|jgi:shikimate kinase|uniref:shikimate kinase n=1 Tax=Christiangramia sp. OXR-203 TaxID=3100176 RepID=UPI002AC9BB48|nr:shikimate kinase [Christiangramia sp. OXR-203]WPY99373.1 shikimate kinase [Christiangramia sp. OXR-203]